MTQSFECNRCGGRGHLLGLYGISMGTCEECKGTGNVQEWRAVDYPLEGVMSNWRPGSHEPPWSWADEINDLFDDPATLELERDIVVNGIREPVLLGNDGRVWDGHHRIVAARIAGLKTIPIKVAPREIDDN